jgi:hypothetical protein
MFCPECDTIMEEVRTIPAAEPADNLVTDLFECPQCHCLDERQRTVLARRSELSNVA